MKQDQNKKKVVIKEVDKRKKVVIIKKVTYCLKCKRNTEIKDTEMIKTKNGRLALSSKCGIGGKKKLRFMKEQEANDY